MAEPYPGHSHTSAAFLLLTIVAKLSILDVCEEGPTVALLVITNVC